MKTLKNLMVAASTAILLLVGCQEEIFNEAVGSDKYQATSEAFSTDTKTTLGENRTVVWSSGDQIAIFEDTSVGKAYKVTNASAGKTSGEFTLVNNLCTDKTSETAGKTIAIYPFSKSLTVSIDLKQSYFHTVLVASGLTFPSRQAYTSGSFCDEAFPMAVITENSSRSLAFKNIGGVIKLSLTGTCAIKEITINGHKDEPLSGPAAVTFGPDGTPSVSMSEDASKSVTLVCDPVVQLDSKNATDFFISVPPTNFKAGFTVTMIDSKGNESTKSTNKAHYVTRSTILAMPEVDNDKEKEIQTFESPYGYEVVQFVKSIGKEVKYPDDVQLIMNWLNDQEFVESAKYIECKDFYSVIQITFIDSKEFFIVTDQNRIFDRLEPLIEIPLLTNVYRIESIPNEVIQDNTNFLYIEGSSLDKKLYRDYVDQINSPLSINHEVIQGLDFSDYSTLGNYGGILIGMTHGTGDGRFLLSTSLHSHQGEDLEHRNANAYYRLQSEDEYPLVSRVVSLEELYSHALHHPFMYANYCWSANFSSTVIINGSFVGYDNLASKTTNIERSYDYFESLFNGHTHSQAYSSLSIDDIREEQWGTLIKSYGEENLRYYSITTEEPDTKDGKAIIKGKINGYKNLKDEVRYKVYLYDGTDIYGPESATERIDLTVADDGTIHQDISEYLEPDIEYTFNIGFEHYENYTNYYIGESKTIKKIEVTYTISEIAKDVVNINEYVSPIFSDCDNMEQLSQHIENIQKIDGVMKAWSTNSSLYIRTKGGLTMSWTYTPEENSEYIFEAQTSSEPDKHMLGNSGITQSYSYDNHDFGHDYRNICIINQQINDLKRNTYLGTYNLLEKQFGLSGFTNVKRVNGDEADLDFFTDSLTNYDIIFLITHGSFDGQNHWISTGEEADLLSKINIELKLKEWNDGKEIVSSNKFYGIRFGTVVEERYNLQLTLCIENISYVGISQKYISEKMEGRFDEAIIFNTSCQSLKGNDGLASAFCSRGAKAYLGYDESNEIGKIAGPSFFINMMRGMTIEEAYNALPEYQKQDLPKETGIYANLHYKPEANKDICIAHLNPITKDTTMVSGKRRLNGTFETPVKGLFENYELGFCYSYTTSTPTVEDSEVIYVENTERYITENTDYYAEVKDIKSGETCYYRFFFKNPHSGEYVYGDTKYFEIEMEKWVDLGLSVLWAAWNVDAKSPEEYGGYYAWGETETKSEYTDQNYKYFLSAFEGFRNIGSEIGGTPYDVAHIKWGDGARMPTSLEISELEYNCSFNEGTYKGVKGVYVTGRNGNRIFLPFVGERFDDRLIAAGSYGGFWSGTFAKGIYGGSNRYAKLLNCGKLDGRSYFNDRASGRPIRPVKKK